MGVHDKGYVPRLWLYFFLGNLGAMWQTTAFWIMGAMSNDPGKLAYFSGLCTSFCFDLRQSGQIILIDNSIQSVGSAGIWRADGAKIP